MTRRLLSGKLGALAAMAMLASNSTVGEPIDFKVRQNAPEPEMNFKPSSKERRKRGGNGKGRKWWNSY